MSADDTIVALSSGALPAGIAVLRLSGPAARLALETLAGPIPAVRQASLRTIRGRNGEIIDRGLVLFLEGPTSVTGEDLAEFHLHGGRAVVAAALSSLTSLPGIRLAEAGEFTRRAFENGRLDLTEAEGLGDLIGAETEHQRRQAVAQAGGALRTLYDGWMRRLTYARAMLEADFDFSDEADVADTVTDQAASGVADLVTEMRAHLSSAHQGEILREGFRVAIVGAPNAGKSSLLNVLARRDVAIVSEVPGTTRDVLEVTLDLAGLPVRLIDTAGLRATQDVVEAIGVERARRAIHEADLVLHLVAPGSKATTHVRPEAAVVLTVASKSDLPGPRPAFDLAFSSKTGAGVDALIAAIATQAREAAGDPDAVLPTRTRHREIVADTLAILEADDFASLPAEIAAETLRRASDRLGALTGRTGVEDLLDVIFSQFCIGK